MAIITRGELKDIHYSFIEERGKIFDQAVRAYMKAAGKYGTDEVILITPKRIHEGLTTNSFNRAIQDLLVEKDVKSMKRGAHEFRLGAKVIQKENDYKGKGVINGQIGYIWSISDEGFSVDFKGEVVEYQKDEIRQIELAYALTGHSYQGSQAKIVIIAFDMSVYILLSRQWLYTAITRAQEQCYIICPKKAHDVTIGKNFTHRRTFMQRILATAKLLMTL